MAFQQPEIAAAPLSFDEIGAQATQSLSPDVARIARTARTEAMPYLVFLVVDVSGGMPVPEGDV